MERFRGLWGNVSGKLGLGFCLAGFVAIFLGWNGAASYDRVPAQFPWLISGGVTGLALVFIGGALLIVENNRRDRATLMVLLEEVRAALEHAPSTAAASNGFARPSQPVAGIGADMVSADMVIAGSSSYHDQGCRLVADRPDLDPISLDDAEERELTACRICNPGRAARKTTKKSGSKARAKSRR